MDQSLTASVVVSRPPEEVYDLVSDVTRMGDWSPVCRSCWWDDGASAKVGDWFSGRNEHADRTWETRSEIVVAERGREFAFVVGGRYTRWGYTFVPVDGGGTLVTESWQLLADGLAMFGQLFEDPDAAIGERAELARTGMPATLATIKATAEGRPSAS